jgi:hypothetical protein
MLDITKFLKTAQINGIKVGLTIEEYITKFGAINDNKKHYYYHDDPLYGFSYFENGVELMFVEGILDTISINSSGTELTILSKYNINCYTDLEKMLFFLEHLDVEWEFLSKHTFQQQLLVQTKTGVQLSFTYDKGHGIMLSKIQRYLD